jgi:hypothetical protein
MKHMLFWFLPQTHENVLIDPLQKKLWDLTKRSIVPGHIERATEKCALM